jgi:hypothetical protein
MGDCALVKVRSSEEVGNSQVSAVANRVLSKVCVVNPHLFRTAEAAVVEEGRADTSGLACLEWRSPDGQGRSEEGRKSGECELHDEDGQNENDLV